MDGLQYLHCNQCPALTHIPPINGLSTLDCSYCRSLTELKVPDTVAYLNTTGCVWLDTHFNFKDSLEKSIYLQKWVKKRRLIIRLKKLIPMIIPIYYHPDAKGGYFDKENMLQFIERSHDRQNIEL
jgi:hypothetical protein